MFNLVSMNKVTCFNSFISTGYQDFTPDVIDEGGIFHPAQYSSFSSLVDKARAWINQSKVG